jgi:AraC family transcriptional regulator
MRDESGCERYNPPMTPPAGAWMTRKSLYQGALFEVGHVVCRPTPELRHDVEHAALNVLALPTAGLFALHPGPRRHVVATPNHAVFISAGRPYRVSFPGCIGDECLTLRLDEEGLARLVPEAMSRHGFAAETLFARAMLPPSALLARNLLARHFLRGEADALLVEELGVGLLAAALESVRPRQRVASRSGHVERVKEAISAEPQRKWTLAELAQVAGVSAYHLAHVFNREAGISVHRYAVRSRLAGALGAVLDSKADLTSIALDSGFASHSHFTARFRAFFGVTPDALRRSARRGAAAQLRKIVTARPALAA